MPTLTPSLELTLLTIQTPLEVAVQDFDLRCLAGPSGESYRKDFEFLLKSVLEYLPSDSDSGFILLPSYHGPVETVVRRLLQSKGWVVFTEPVARSQTKWIFKEA